MAGLRAVEGARSSGFDGTVTLIGAEEYLPYDRPALSKSFLTDAEEPSVPWLAGVAALRTELDVDLRLGVPADGVDVVGRTVRAGGAEVPYDTLVIATGARARTLPGAEGLAGVHTVRTVDDARAVRAALLRAPRTVVVGSGLIGSEIAAAAWTRGSKVTVVEAGPAPFDGRAGGFLGSVCASLHRAHGTDLRCGVTVASFEGQGHVQAVTLSDGTRLEADCVVVGIGAAPVTEWLDGTGVAVADGVLCDEMLRTSEPGVLAAGDVARIRGTGRYGGTRHEHWTRAAEQGALAGSNAVSPGSAQPFASVPYFWTDWYGTRVQGLGDTDSGEPWTVGDPSTGSFAVLYREGGRLAGAIGFDRSRDMTVFRRLLRRGATWDETAATVRQRGADLFQTVM